MHKTFTEISTLPPVVFHEDVYLLTGAGAVFAKRERSERKLKNIFSLMDGTVRTGEHVLEYRLPISAV